MYSRWSAYALSSMSTYQLKYRAIVDAVVNNKLASVSSSLHPGVIGGEVGGIPSGLFATLRSLVGAITISYARGEVNAIANSMYALEYGPSLMLPQFIQLPLEVQDELIGLIPMQNLLSGASVRLSIDKDSSPPRKHTAYTLPWMKVPDVVPGVNTRWRERAFALIEERWAWKRHQWEEKWRAYEVEPAGRGMTWPQLYQEAARRAQRGPARLIDIPVFRREVSTMARAQLKARALAPPDKKEEFADAHYWWYDNDRESYMHSRMHWMILVFTTPNRISFLDGSLPLDVWRDSLFLFSDAQFQRVQEHLTNHEIHRYDQQVTTIAREVDESRHQVAFFEAEERPRLLEQRLRDVTSIVRDYVGPPTTWELVPEEEEEKETPQSKRQRN
jgi:hypothetical protein